MQQSVSSKQALGLCLSPRRVALTSGHVGIDVKKAIALELRDWTEQHRDPAEVARYLGVELPIIIQTLRDGESATRRDAPEQVSASVPSCALNICSTSFSRVRSVGHARYSTLHNRATPALRALEAIRRGHTESHDASSAQRQRGHRRDMRQDCHQLQPNLPAHLGTA